MAKQVKPPKTQAQLSTGNPDNLNRALMVKRDDKIKDYKIKLIDIDTAIKFFFDKIILPTVNYQNNESAVVPLIYGSPEKWKSVRADGFYRTPDGKIQIPLIMFKRNSIAKFKDLSNKIDEGHPVTYQSFQKQYSVKNRYTPWNIIHGIKPVYEYYNVVVPEYVTITYEFIIWTDTVELMNDIIESVNYAEGSYWGEPDRFKFRASVDSYTSNTELTADDDRTIQTTFTLTIQGYIVSDTLNRKIANDLVKTVSPSVVKVKFSEK